jgi:UDP-glucose 4-epimerase
MADIVVTGSSGFIGLNLCRRLAQAGYDVVGIDLEPPAFELPNAVETRIMDLTTTPELPEADTIVHLAAHAQVQPIVTDPDRALENIAMTKHVLEEADRMDAFLVNASSRDVYGSALEPSEEDITSDSPNGYAASKLGAEALANAYRHTRDVPVTSLRLANVYGPMDTNRRVIPLFIAHAVAGEELTVYGDGKLLDFVHIDDVCDAVLRAVSRKEVIDGRTINLGSGTGTPLSEVAAVVSEAVDACPGWRVDDDRAGDVGQYVSDLSTAKAVLDFEPSVRLEHGLSATIEWYAEHPEMLAELRAADR